MIEVIIRLNFFSRFLYIRQAPILSKFGLEWEIPSYFKTDLLPKKFFPYGFSITTGSGCYNSYQFTHHSSHSEKLSKNKITKEYSST